LKKSAEYRPATGSICIGTDDFRPHGRFITHDRLRRAHGHRQEATCVTARCRIPGGLGGVLAVSAVPPRWKLTWIEQIEDVGMDDLVESLWKFRIRNFGPAAGGNGQPWRQPDMTTQSQSTANGATALASRR
jgi:hypothetical protein